MSPDFSRHLHLCLASIFNDRNFTRDCHCIDCQDLKKWMLCLSVQPSFNLFQNSLNLWKILLEVWPIPSQTCSIWHDMAGKWATEVKKSIDHWLFHNVSCETVSYSIFSLFAFSIASHVSPCFFVVKSSHPSTPAEAYLGSVGDEGSIQVSGHRIVVEKDVANWWR
jgi:hypothetical protein